MMRSTGADPTARAAVFAAVFAAALAAALAACRAEVWPPQRTTGADSAAVTRYHVGSPPGAAAVRALDSDIDAAGHGLPRGRGDARRGATLFVAQCAACHGLKGEGMAPLYPRLIGREPRQGFPFASDLRLTATIGNYWPWPTTLYDYVRRAMPFTAPGSLTDDDVYSLTAYLLAANEILPAGATLDSASLVAVRMPARDRFVPDDRRGGPEVR